MNVLVVEDNERLAASVAEGLREEGHSVETVARGDDAISRIETHRSDVVVLDLGLPDLDGLEVLQRIRARGVVLPVLVLTARDAVDDRVRALDTGADDYLVKPFAFEELVARINALARRAAAPRWTALSVGGVRLVMEEPAVEIRGIRVALSPREHALLVCLARRVGEPVSRTEILREVFGYDFDPGTNLIDVHVGHLRKKIAGAALRIETVRSIGYRAVVEEAS